MSRHPLLLMLFVYALVVGHRASIHAAEIVRLDESNWDTHAPGGKEVDAIYGDFVLRNDTIVAVVANPVAGRDANLTITEIGGCLLDLTFRDHPNDQLSAFYPIARQVAPLRAAKVVTAKGDRVELLCTSDAGPGKPVVETRYIVEDGKPCVTVKTAVTNPSDEPVTISRWDDLRADKTFVPGESGDGGVVWVHEPWWDATYGVVAGDKGRGVSLVGARPGRSLARVSYPAKGGNGEKRDRIGKGETFTLARHLIPGRNEMHVRATALTLRGKRTRPVTLTVTDPDGAVARAGVYVNRDGEPYGSGHADAQGVIAFGLPAGKFDVEVTGVGRTKQKLSLEVADEAITRHVTLDAPGYVHAKITDANGGPIPCKVQFIGKGDTRSPKWFNNTGIHAVEDCYYSHDGVFRQPIDPGNYDVIISRGPEYDAVFTTLAVERGKDAELTATLKRVMDTTGWISADFHSHSSQSGDNVSHQRGRVLNLLAEHIEFAPCTEHQRITSYTPHLDALGVAHLMATAPGMELTGRPLPLNHHNVFPLVHKPHTQFGGGPRIDSDPVLQIKRVAMWDDNADKLVQQNHPNIVAHAWDRDTDGKADGGYAAMLPYMDVIEIHPPVNILRSAAQKKGVNTGRNRMHSWLLLINQGTYIPGVVNTDAHYNHHGSGWLRNWIKSPTDDPAKVKTLDIVHASERGNIVMSNGPFMEVVAKSAFLGRKVAFPGDTLSGSDAEPLRPEGMPGATVLFVTVQCPNWFDIDRVQVFVNGRPDPKLNFTRKSHPGKFAEGVVKFDQTIVVNHENDAHLIVVAIGERSRLGRVMGKVRGADQPIAVSNPIFVDVDGDGFTPNKDTLGAPFPK